MRRMLVSMSQEKLGEQLGLTFQQVQKYEKGANRIGASRLFQISQILTVPVDFFFDGLQAEDVPGHPGFAENSNSHFELDILSTSEGIQLNSAFFSIKDANIRKKMLDLLKALGAAENAEEQLAKATPAKVVSAAE